MIGKLLSIAFPPELGHIPERSSSLGYIQRLENTYGDWLESADEEWHGIGAKLEWSNGRWREVCQ